MPTQINRQSINKDLASRYATQRAGGAFDVKRTLGNPGTSPATGTTIDAVSLQGNNFQSPVGFEVKTPQGVTQLKDAQSTKSKELSLYMKGFTNTKYHA